MPLLMCPNDDSPMTTVDRSGVQFDMCPTCRGVWLDRGELEKLITASRDEAAPVAAQLPPPAWREPRSDPRRYERDDDDYRRYGHNKKKRFDLFDIFD